MFARRRRSPRPAPRKKRGIFDTTADTLACRFGRLKPPGQAPGRANAALENADYAIFPRESLRDNLAEY